MPNTRRHSYDLNFKLKIVAEAEAVNNNREIAREYGISESMVRKWRNQQHVLFSGELKMTAKRASMGRYRPKDPEVDQQLVDWFSDQRSQGKNCSLKITFITALLTSPLQVVYVGLSLIAFVFIFAGLAVNSLMIRLKAKELSSDPEFKASPGWYTKWKRRHAISMRTKTTLAQRLPADMEDKVVEFHRFVLRARKRCGYESSHILNMDETPMRFELPATRTLEFSGNRTVPILSCGGDKQSFTVVLAVKANGEKLPPKVIFKGVRQLRIEVPRRMQVSVHKKAWMDEEGLFFHLYNFRSI